MPDIKDSKPEEKSHDGNFHEGPKSDSKPVTVSQPDTQPHTYNQTHMQSHSQTHYPF